MEISLVAPRALKVKGKQATLLVNPHDSSTPAQAALFFQKTTGKLPAETISIVGPGEYEIGGIKISGMKTKEGIVYSVIVDDVEVLIGDLMIINKLQHKLREHNIVLIQTDDSETDASFINGLATNVVMLYGEKAKEVIEKFAKEGMQQVSKFQSTKEKLPQEIQTVLLS